MSFIKSSYVLADVRAWMVSSPAVLRNISTPSAKMAFGCKVCTGVEQFRIFTTCESALLYMVQNMFVLLAVAPQLFSFTMSMVGLILTLWFRQPKLPCFLRATIPVQTKKAVYTPPHMSSSAAKTTTSLTPSVLYHVVSVSPFLLTSLHLLIVVGRTARMQCKVSSSEDDDLPLTTVAALPRLRPRKIKHESSSDSSACSSDHVPAAAGILSVCFAVYTL